MAGGDFEDDALGGAPLSTGSSDLDLINNVGDQSVGKHMLLMVPDFYNVAEAGTSPKSTSRCTSCDSRSGSNCRSRFRTRRSSLEPESL